MFYTVSIYIYGFVLHFAALFHPKAKKWVKGRKNIFQNLPIVKEKNVIWFHCASLGEYDQGKPIIEAWKEKNPDDFILITFFSPSGYENIIQKSLGDYTCYLPLDTPRNAKRFIQHFQPKKAFFIKYEVWINFLKACSSSKCELYSVSAHYRKEQIYFKWYGNYFRKALQLFDHIFVQYSSSKSLLHKIGIDKVTISGDTRYDRVYQRALAVKENAILSPWTKNNKILIIGSSWREDEEIILPLICEGKIKEKIILAPHEVNANHIQQITSSLSVKFQLFTELEKGEVLAEDTQVVILNCIGFLAEAYQYGDLAYVGGGFRTGLHNILEPAAFGLPVIFGAKHHKFPEAQAFIEEGIGTEIHSNSDFMKAYTNYLEDKTITEKVSAFVKNNTGATKIVMDYFQN